MIKGASFPVITLGLTHRLSSYAVIICSMNETPRIPSPIPYLMQVPDLRAHNTTYDWRMLFMPVLMGLGSGRTNVLAIAQ